MRCDDVQSMLDLHLESELTAELNTKVERHLLRCPVCAYEAHTLEQTRSMLQSAVPVAEPSPGFRERTAARLLNELGDSQSDELRRERGRQWTLPLVSGE